MIQKIFILVSVTILVSSCITRETYSNNFYMIHNESSETLFFKPSDDKAELTINPDEEATLEEFLTFGKSGYNPDIYFTDRAIANSTDISITKDSMGIQVTALILNSENVLDWEKDIIEESRNNSTIHYILNVTDDMIK